MARKRNYRMEYLRDHATAAAKKERAARNAAHRKLSPPKGMEVDHIKPLKAGGTNDASNLRVVPRSVNRKKGGK